MCVCDTATRHRGFRPAYAETLFGTSVSDGFRERLCAVFASWYGVPPQSVGAALDAHVSRAEADGAGLPEALGEFLVQLVELDV